jgi:hypothetical protein
MPSKSKRKKRKRSWRLINPSRDKEYSGTFIRRQRMGRRYWLLSFRVSKP